MLSLSCLYWLKMSVKLVSLIPNVELKDMRYAIVILFVLVKDVSKAGQLNNFTNNVNKEVWESNCCHVNFACYFIWITVILFLICQSIIEINLSTEGLMWPQWYVRKFMYLCSQSLWLKVCKSDLCTLRDVTIDTTLQYKVSGSLVVFSTYKTD